MKVKKADEVPRSTRLFIEVKIAIKKAILPNSLGPSNLATSKLVVKFIPLLKILPIKLTKNLDLILFFDIV